VSDFQSDDNAAEPTGYSVWHKIYIDGDVPKNIFAPIDRPMNTLQLYRCRFSHIENCRIAGIFAYYKKSGSTNTMVTSDLYRK